MKYWMILLFFWSGVFQIKSQTSDIAKYPTVVIPPSPNAAELGRYGNVPVSLFTGTVNQSIPIANIEIGNYGLSLGLSYSSGGVRVSQEASHVGLGWSLNAGGVITRSVLGMPDEEYYLTPNARVVPIGEMEHKNDFAYFMNLSENVYDAQPDIFYYNFDGKSGRFFFDQNKQAHFAKQDNIKISWLSINRFEIVVENGMKYIFQDVEMSSSDSKVGNVYYFPSTWYLSSIESARGDEILNFTYENYNTFSKQYTSSTFTESYSMYGPAATANHCSSDLPVDNGGIYTTTIQAKILSEILFRSGKIEFESSVRADHFSEKKIDKIVVSNLEGVLKEFVFQYSYFNNDEIVIEATDIKRLKLEKLIQRDRNGVNVSEYAFQYNETQHLPTKSSFAQDHWGFYNGANTNTHLVPPYKYFYTDQTGTWVREKPGANRDVDEQYLKAGVLTQVTYPTGGSTKYVYEANDIGGGTEMIFPETNITQAVITDIQNNVFSQESTFSVNKMLNAIITANFPSSDYLDQNGIKCNPSFSFINVTDDVNVLIIDNFSYSQEIFNGSVTLYPGKVYKIKVEETDSRCFNSETYSPYLESELRVVYTDANTSLPQVQVNIPKEKIGGLRIKKIEDFDGNGHVFNSRSFDYSDGYNFSSGRIMERPIYEYIYEIAMHNATDPNGGTPDCPTNLCSYLVRKSTSNIDLGTVQGNHICYTKVTESLGELGSNGKVEYEYSFITDPGGENNSPGIYPFPPATSYDFFRGNLIKRIEYDKENNVVRELTNLYESKILDTITAMKCVKKWGGFTYWICFDPAQFVDPPDYKDQFSNPNYYLISATSRLKESKEKLYTPSGNLETVTKFEYYHNYNMPSRIEKADSDGKKGISYFSYYFDYDGGTEFIDYLANKNIIQPIEKVEIKKDASSNEYIIAGQLIKFVDGRPTEGFATDQSGLISKASWKFSNQNIGVLPTGASVGAFNPDTKYSRRFRVTAYDEYDNLLEQKMEENIAQSYIWDYSSTYPVAETKNAARSEIAYTSFEADGVGNWQDLLPGNIISNTRGVTGKKYYNLTYEGLTAIGLDNSKRYKVTYWSKNGMYDVSGAGTSGYPRSVKTVSIDGVSWTCWEHVVGSVTLINISGVGGIDELRLYPVDAKMTTNTYEPLVGMTSQCDANNRITYYEYDGFGRLTTVRDQDGNVVKTLDYQYQQPNNQ